MNHLFPSPVSDPILAPERVVATFEFEGMPGHVLLGTVTFAAQEGKSRFTEKLVFQSVDGTSIGFDQNNQRIVPSFTSCPAILSRGNTLDTAPRAIASLGIPKTTQLASSCAMV